MQAFEYKHVVGFEETNLVGNVYFTHHISWQGRCRELFLREHAPDVLEGLNKGLLLVTTRTSCDYFAELYAFDEIVIRMRLGALAQNRITMVFEYWRATQNGEELAARGEQQVVCMHREGNQVTPMPIPETLLRALKQYA